MNGREVPIVIVGIGWSVALHPDDLAVFAAKLLLSAVGTAWVES